MGVGGKLTESLAVYGEELGKANGKAIICRILNKGPLCGLGCPVQGSE